MGVSAVSCFFVGRLKEEGKGDSDILPHHAVEGCDAQEVPLGRNPTPELISC